MRKFLVNSVFFILPIVLFVCIAEYALRKIPNDYAFKNHYLKHNASEIETLFLGSSHAYYGINPEHYPGNSFNASHISQSIDLDYRLLDKYSDEFERLEYIVIPIDYLTLFSRTSTGIEYWRMKNYNIYYNFRTSLNPEDYMELFSISLKYNMYRLMDYYYHGKSNISCSALGYGITDLNQEDLIETGKDAASRHKAKDKKQVKESLEFVAKIIKLATEKSANVLFYTSPAYESYTNNLDSIQYQLTVNSIDSIAGKHDNTFYYNLMFDRQFTKKDFRDADHLNTLGAEKLTKEIERIIGEIKWSKKGVRKNI